MLVLNQQGLVHRFGDQLLQLLGRGGGVDVELGVALAFAVVRVDRDLLVAGVGAAQGLQLPLDEEQLVALLLMHVDLVVADPGVGA